MLMPSIFGEDLFDDWMTTPSFRTVTDKMTADLMRTDIKDVDGGYELNVDLPGFSKEDMKLQLKDGYLTIQAARKSSNDEKDDNGKFVRRERYYGECSRTFYVGRNIKQEDVHAKYENGVLKVTFPKDEVKKEIEDKKFISIEG